MPEQNAAVPEEPLMKHVNDVFLHKGLKEVVEGEHKFLVDSTGEKRWCDQPFENKQRTKPGLFMLSEPQAKWFDLSKPDDLKAYNRLLKDVAPYDAPTVEIDKEVGQFHDGSYLNLVIYHRVWYLMPHQK